MEDPLRNPMSGKTPGKSIHATIRRVSLKLTVIYILLGGAWILFSDRILLWYFEDPALLTRVQTAKGWFFVAATAFLLTWLVRRFMRQAYREDALREEIISHIPIYVFWKDPEDCYLGCNQRFASVAGVGSRENIVGKTDYDLTWRKEDAESIRSNDFMVMRTGKPLLDVEETQLQSDGKVATFLTSRVPLKGDSDKVVGILGICSDITRRKREEEELRESRDRAEAIVDAALDAIVEMDEAGSVIGWNARAEEIFGWSAEEMSGRQLADTLIPERYRAAHEKGMQRFLETGKGPILNRRIQVSALHQDGHEVPVELAVTAARRHGAYSFTGFIEDITERKKGEKALRESRKRFRDLVERINDWVWEVDRNGVYTYASPRVRELLGYEPEEVIGRTPFDLMPEFEAQRVRAVFGELKEKRQSFTALENTNQHKDGHQVVLETSGVPFFDEEGNLLGYRGVDRDITERKQAEEALLESDRMKTDFIRTVAHEFRTPLTSIQGFSELLLNREDLSPEQRREFLGYIHQRSVALAGIVSDLLDIARIEEGLALPLTKERCTIKEIFDQLRPFLEATASEKRVVINLAEEDASVVVDRAKLGQVLENILSNALKFSAEGSPVRIRGKMKGEFYRVSVTDQGIGMTPEQVNQVFDKFYRADASHTAVEGVGLGMNIVKNIVEAHGGRIEVKSEPDRGTTVSFTLPRSSTTQQNQEKVQQ